MNIGISLKRFDCRVRVINGCADRNLNSNRRDNDKGAATTA